MNKTLIDRSKTALVVTDLQKGVIATVLNSKWFKEAVQVDDQVAHQRDEGDFWRFAASDEMLITGFENGVALRISGFDCKQ
jgi:hypothetical protein